MLRQQRLVQHGVRLSARAAAPSQPHCRALVTAQSHGRPTWQSTGRAPTSLVHSVLPPSVASQTRSMFIQTQTTPNPNRWARCPFTYIASVHQQVVDVHTINAAAHGPPRSLVRAFVVGWGSPDRCVPVLRSLMFVPGCPVMESGSANFISPREAMGSPLAKKLFAIEGEHVPPTP
jgi:hypothetical protein